MELLKSTPEADSFLREWHNPEPYIIARTSGSTGIPKEIWIPKKDMLLSAEATCVFFGLDSSSMLVCPLSADYIAGKMMLVRAMVAGCSLAMETPASMIRLDGFEEITLMPVVPAQLAGISREDYPKIRNLIVGGAPVSPAQERELADSSLRSFATYGMTETASHVALRHIGHDNFFTALPGISFATDSDSCLRIVAPGYSFGELQTNDIVELISDKKFIWKGRRDNVVISGGIKLFPEEIEDKILRAGIIDRPFFIAGVPDEKWGQRLEMVVESEVTIPLEEALSAVLSRYEKPKKIHFRKQLPRTRSGKIIRKIHPF